MDRVSGSTTSRDPTVVGDGSGRKLDDSQNVYSHGDFDNALTVFHLAVLNELFLKLVTLYGNGGRSPPPVVEFLEAMRTTSVAVLRIRYGVGN